MLHLRRNVGLSLTDKMWTGLEFSMRLRVSSAYKYKWKIGRDTRPNILCIIEVNQRKPWQPWLQHNIIDLYICHQLIRKTTGNTARGRGTSDCGGLVSLSYLSAVVVAEEEQSSQLEDNHLLARCIRAKLSAPSPHRSIMEIRGEIKI